MKVVQKDGKRSSNQWSFSQKNCEKVTKASSLQVGKNTPLDRQDERRTVEESIKMKRLTSAGRHLSYCSQMKRFSLLNKIITFKMTENCCKKVHRTFQQSAEAIFHCLSWFGPVFAQQRKHLSYFSNGGSKSVLNCIKIKFWEG